MIEGEQERELLREKEGKKTDEARERDIDGGEKERNSMEKERERYEVLVNCEKEERTEGERREEKKRR